MSVTIDGSTGITAPTYGGAVTAEYSVPVTGFKNRILNGQMVIDQRNAGASTSVSSGTTFYGTDRFAGFFGASATGCTSQQSTTAPTGFINSFKFAVGTGASSSAGQSAWVGQKIEGLNVSDLAWGSASASTVTLSFWVYASGTGTYCVNLQNSAGDRSYVATYTISNANTWEQKTITVAGDTSGTWLTTTGIGINIRWDLGTGSTYNTSTTSAWQAGDYRNTSAQKNVIGTSSATFYITGVQLEKGSTATSFDYRPYGTEFMLCQRYYENQPSNYLIFSGNVTSGFIYYAGVPFLVTKRATPTITMSNGGTLNFPNTSPTAGSNSQPNGFQPFMTANGTGAGYFQFGYTASAEL